METKKPLKSTVLFIGIFIIGIILVTLLIDKALEMDHTVTQVDQDVIQTEQVKKVSA